MATKALMASGAPLWQPSLRDYYRMRDAVDIAAWLRELGLERYVQAFRDSEVEPEILAELTDEDSQWHRRRRSVKPSAGS